ncbi:MAG: ribosome assembly cofactor RimP [Flavobacteriales bacterium]|nr:ribosome assembly cofactor RimP [Flavobacteriales bacterium]
MIAEERVSKLAKEKVLELGGFLVSVKVNPQNGIKVFVDKNEGISIIECLQISRYIESKLDREIEDFQLSVSSPGLSNPFLVQEQYQKNIGKDVVIKLKDGKKIKGKLLAFDEKLKIETSKKEKGKKKIIKQEKIISSEEIKETKLIIKFKK